MIKAVIFDFFDVIRTDPYNAWLKQHGYVREGGFLDASQKVDGGLIDVNQFFDMLSTLSNQSASEIKQSFEAAANVDAGVIEIIERLKPHYKLSLLSNSSSNLLRTVLREKDLEKYFDEIIVSSEVGHIKPSKEIFEIALERLDVKPDEALFIDDNPDHTEGGEKIGIQSIVFTSAAELEADLRNLNVL